MSTPVETWPYVPTLGRLALALAIGLFVGIERERRHKGAGVRTFAFAATLGAVGGLLGPAFGLLALGLLGALVVLLNIDTIRSGDGAELTTSAALLVTAFAGLLAGQGHTFTPTLLGVTTAALLAWKQPLAGFSEALTESELRSAILLAILAFVVYPVLPTGSLDPWRLILPRVAWITVILVAALGFCNYVLLKLYGPRGVEFTGFLGGLVNSTVTVTELANRLRLSGGQLLEVTFRAVVLATLAMLSRNTLILGLLAPAALVSSAIPLGLMLVGTTAAAAVDARRRRIHHIAPTTVAPEKPVPAMQSPFSLTAALKFGVIFLALQVAGTAAQHVLGAFGFYAVSLAGGVVSSASAVAAAANLAAADRLSPHVAGIGAIIASLMSAAVNLPVVARLGGDHTLTRRLAWTIGGIVVLGILGTAVQAHWPLPPLPWDMSPRE